MARTEWCAAQAGGGGGEDVADRATAAGAGAGSPVEKAVCGHEGVDSGRDHADDANASGALGGFALNARPTASQGCAPEGTRSKGNNKRKGDTSIELRKGTFLKRLDNACPPFLTSKSFKCNLLTDLVGLWAAGCPGQRAGWRDQSHA